MNLCIEVERRLGIAKPLSLVEVLHTISRKREQGF